MPMRHAADAVLEQQGVDAELRATLVLALDEACANIIRHAFGGGCGSGRIELLIRREGKALHFVLSDTAACVDVERIKPRDLDECRPGGLGLCFIDTLMDAWKLTPLAGGGNRLWMLRRLDPADRSADEHEPIPLHAGATPA
jgi:sigma-B regulation protein RsbU (phosphoserine phosphatase)